MVVVHIGSGEIALFEGVSQSLWPFSPASAAACPEVW